MLVPKAKINGDAAAVLSLINICDRMHALPNSGGILDQDSLFVYLLDKIIVWESERAELDKAKQQQATGRIR